MSFKDYEYGLLNTFSVSKFYKSWLIFYRCGLVDVEVRGKIKFEGYMPWNNVDPGNWNYYPWFINQIGDNNNNQSFLYQEKTNLSNKFHILENKY